MMLKMSQNIMPTSRTLKMAGMALMREFTTICRTHSQVLPTQSGRETI